MVGARMRAPICVRVARAPCASSQPRKRRSAAAATLPASTSDAIPAPPGRYVITVTTSAPPGQRTMPLSCRATLIQPALWSTRTPGEPPHLAVDLAGVAHVGEEVEQVARVGRREARLRGAERAAAAAREPDGAQQARRGRRRSTSCRCPQYGWLSTRSGIAPPARKRVRLAERVELVAAVHLRVDEPERAHQRVDERRAAGGRAAEVASRCRSRPRCRSTSASGAGAGRASSRASGVPSVRASAVTAIASFRVEAAGNVARAFQAAPAPVVRFWT